MPLDALSEKKLARVKPALVDVVRRAAEISTRAFSIVQGNRTQAEQNAIYAQGRSKPGKIVTWTKNSKHIGGNAVDFAALVNGRIVWDAKLYPAIANAFKQAAAELKTGIEWGGDWKTKDWGHVQLSQKSPTPTRPTADIGWTISDVQTALVKHGVDPGTIDGILGRKTRAALTAFQRAKGLPETGGPDKVTTDELAKAPGPVVVAETPQGVPGTKGSVRWSVERLQSLGLSRQSAIALTANLMWESGGHGSINWSAHGDNNHSHGAGQWNDRAGRFQELERFAADSGSTWDDPDTQLQFMVDELKTTEIGAMHRLESATTLKEAMEAALTYWRPSIPHTDKRVAIAERLNKEIEDA